MSQKIVTIDVERIAQWGKRVPGIQRIVGPIQSRRRAALSGSLRSPDSIEPVTTDDKGAGNDLKQHDPWFFEHYITAVNHVRDFIAGEDLSLEGSTVADIGCGDGIIDLGIAKRLNPLRLVGFDIEPVDTAGLAQKASTLLDEPGLPTNLSFVQSAERGIPAEDESFDWAVSWSAFEHISDPLSVAKEIRRILKPTGLFFLQLYPFYHSEWGSHLEEWFPQPFVQHRSSTEEIASHLRANPLADRPEWNEVLVSAFNTLNRITLDDLQQALRGAGFSIVRAELYTNTVRIPPETQDVPLSSVMISGVKLLARPE
jgi:ubiquinone/menaquinone biosynthesis C-methylase UbiE